MTTTPAPMSAEISHDEANKIATRLINSHFRQEPHARVSIPARPEYDDDIRIIAYIDQQRALKGCREALGETDAALLDRALAAEAKLETARRDALEEAARLVETIVVSGPEDEGIDHDDYRDMRIAEAIRALQQKDTAP